ncbi:hypothetical protein F4809DRAFT_642532 [Biscogniauxia mediterranea]|nr:hypothetical protein F4809DRAFT_642532 [Biscogniauxia mediterranea]
MAALPQHKALGASGVIMDKTGMATTLKVTAGTNDLQVDLGIWFPMANPFYFGSLLCSGTSIYGKALPNYVVQGMVHKREERYTQAYYTRPADTPMWLTPENSTLGTPDMSPDTFVFDYYHEGRDSLTSSQDSSPQMSTTPLPIAHAIALSLFPPASPTPSLNPQATSFQPMTTTTQQPSPPPPPPPPRLIATLPPTSLERSTAYRGDLADPLNNSADIPESASVGLWIDRLPARCTPADVLGRIRGCGRVFALHINPPRDGVVATSAAKLSFWTVAGKERFLVLVERGEFVFESSNSSSNGRRQRSRHYYRPRVVHSAIRVPERDPAARSSRVVHVAGPAAVVNRAYLEALFAAHLTWTLECVVDHGGEISRSRSRRRRASKKKRGGDDDDENKKKDEEEEEEEEEEEVEEIAWLEYRFSSYRAQAARAWQLLSAIKRGEEEEPRVSERERDVLKKVEFWWGADPCA